MKQDLLIIAGSDIDTYYDIETFLKAGDSCMAYPAGKKVGGCILNVGCIASGFGMNVRVLDYLKEDDEDTELLKGAMKRYGLDISLLRYGKDVVNGNCLIMRNGDEKCIYVIPQSHPLYDLSDGSLQKEMNGTGYIYSLMHTLHESFGYDCLPVKEAKKRGVKLALDGSSQYRDLKECETIFLADHVFFNQQACGRFSEALGKDGIAALLENGTETVCVTEGSKGASCYTKKGRLFLPSPKIPYVKDSTAAGDSFAAAFLFSLSEGKDIPSALKRAVYAGSRKCLYEGALGGVCSKEELDSFIQKYE